MKEEIKKALENIGKALAHPDLKMSQLDHLQLISDYKIILKELNNEDEKDITGHLEKL